MGSPSGQVISTQSLLVGRVLIELTVLGRVLLKHSLMVNWNGMLVKGNAQVGEYFNYLKASGNLIIYNYYGIR